jgi:CRISPR system Cascade subunit CasB
METPRPRFPFPNESQDSSYAILLDWWKGLDAAKGDRADLRRAENPLRIAFNPAYHELLHRLQEAGYRLGADGCERLALLAGLSVHVKQHLDSAQLAALMGNPHSAGEKARVSELRFRRILATDDLGELYVLLRRAISLLDGTANLIDLARVIFLWRPIAEQHSYDPRKEWAYEYYAAAPRS